MDYIKKNYKVWLIVIIEWLITFATDRYYFNMNEINITNYAVCKCILFIFLLIIWHLIFYLINKKYIKYLLIYLIPITIILLLIYPGFMFGSDVNNFIIYSKSCEYLYHLNYLTSIFWTISIMIIPTYTTVMFIQALVFGLILTFIILKVKKIYQNKYATYLIYFLGFISSTIVYTLYPNRPCIYGILYLFLFSYLFFEYIEKNELTFKKIIMYSIFTSILSFWRNEGIYLLIAIPFLVTIIYKLYKKLQLKLLIWIIPIALYIPLTIPQNNYYNNLGEIASKERNLPNIISPLSYMLRSDLKGKNKDKYLADISKVLDLDILKRHLSIYETVAMWEDGGCIKKGYTVKEFKQMQSSYYKLVLDNPIPYLIAKTKTFAKATRLFGDDFTSINYLDDKISTSSSLRVILIKIRRSILRILEGREVNTIYKIIYRPFNSLLIPLLTILYVFIKSIIRKDLNKFFLTGMLMGHSFLLFMVAPASYFMYYYPIYLSGYFLFFYYLISYTLIKNNRVLFISSTGGHLEELLQLKPTMDKYDYFLITEKTETNKNLENKYVGRVGYLVYGTRKNIIKYIFVLLINFFKSIKYYFKIRPNVIVTTGTHTAVLMCYIGKLFGAKIVFIETYANRNTKTLSGRIVYPIADLFIVQWEDMLKLYPKAIYYGGVY